MASLNKVMLIGNLTRDPEIKYTPKGMAIAAAANPPSTRAPSPPMIVRPSWAGIATVKAVRIKGEAR